MIYSVYYLYAILFKLTVKQNNNTPPTISITALPIPLFLFQELSSDLVERLAAPVTQALKEPRWVFG